MAQDFLWLAEGNAVWRVAAEHMKCAEREKWWMWLPGYGYWQQRQRRLSENYPDNGNLFIFYLAPATARPFPVCGGAEKAQPSACVLSRTRSYWKLRSNNTT